MILIETQVPFGLQITTSIVLPIAISLLMPLLLSWIQKRRDFNYDYRKYILEKRKEAYNIIENIIEEISLKRNFPDKPSIHDAFYKKGVNAFNDFNSKVAKGMDKVIWISDNMLYELQCFNDLLGELHIKVASKAIREEDIDLRGNDIVKQIAEESFQRIENIRRNLATIYFKDITELDNFKKYKGKKYYHD